VSDLQAVFILKYMNNLLATCLTLFINFSSRSWKGIFMAPAIFSQAMVRVSTLRLFVGDTSIPDGIGCLDIECNYFSLLISLCCISSCLNTMHNVYVCIIYIYIYIYIYIHTYIYMYLHTHTWFSYMTRNFYPSHSHINLKFSSFFTGHEASSKHRKGTMAQWFTFFPLLIL